MPANNIWLGLTSSFTDPNNWSLGQVPTIADTLVFDGDVSTMSVTLDYPAPSNPPTAGLGYAGIRLIDDYSGTVTLPFTLTFGDFEQECGQIAQPNSASDDLVVTGSFRWTAGILNNTSNTGTVKLVGVANAVMGMDETTIYTGSTIRLESYGAVGTTMQHDGTVVFNNEADVEINSACQLIPKPPQNPLIEAIRQLKSGRVEDKEKNLITCYIGGVYKSEGGVKTDMGLIVDGGLILVAKGDGLTGKLEATGRTDALPDSPSVQVKRGELNIRNGETLVALNGVVVGQTEPTAFQAYLQTLARPTTEGNQTARIEGKVTVLSGVINLGKANGSILGQYSTLHITDDFAFLGGTYNAWVSTTVTSVKDMIHSEEKVKITSSATITPKFGDTPPGQNVTWDVIEAEKGAYEESTEPTTSAGWTPMFSNYGTSGKRIGLRKD